MQLFHLDSLWFYYIHSSLNIFGFDFATMGTICHSCKECVFVTQVGRSSQFNRGLCSLVETMFSEVPRRGFHLEIAKRWQDSGRKETMQRHQCVKASKGKPNQQIWWWHFRIILEYPSTSTGSWKLIGLDDAVAQVVWNRKSGWEGTGWSALCNGVSCLQAASEWDCNSTFREKHKWQEPSPLVVKSRIGWCHNSLEPRGVFKKSSPPIQQRKLRIVTVEPAKKPKNWSKALGISWEFVAIEKQRQSNDITKVMMMKTDECTLLNMLTCFL